MLNESESVRPVPNVSEYVGVCPNNSGVMMFRWLELAATLEAEAGAGG